MFHFKDNVIISQHQNIFMTKSFTCLGSTSGYEILSISGLLLLPLLLVLVDIDSGSLDDILILTQNRSQPMNTIIQTAAIHMYPMTSI